MQAFLSSPMVSSVQHTMLVQPTKGSVASLTTASLIVMHIAGHFYQRILHLSLHSLTLPPSCKARSTIDPLGYCSSI